MSCVQEPLRKEYSIAQEAQERLNMSGHQEGKANAEGGQGVSPDGGETLLLTNSGEGVRVEDLMRALQIITSRGLQPPGLEGKRL